MDNHEIGGRLKKLIVKHSVLSISEADISDDSDLVNDFGYDSVQIMRFLAEVEKEFEMEFKDDDLSLDVLGRYKGLKGYIEQIDRTDK